jgi:peptidoglycan/xylan/chitin deacetylase (PgdA/CDA1 family)
VRSLKRVAGSIRLPLGVARLLALRLTGRRAGVALMYHRVEPRQGDVGREFTPPASTRLFDRHLRHLRRFYRVVEAAELQTAAAERRRGGRFPVAVTFDDDTISHVDHAAPLLRRHTLPATFFLNGLGLDGPSAYWWERLQAAFDAAGSWEAVLPAEIIEDARARARTSGKIGAWEITQAIEHLSVAERRVLSEAVRERLGSDPPECGLRREQVRRLVDDGHAIGFHGWHHEPLSLLPEQDMEAELDGGRPELEAVVGAPLRLIAYPHGKAGPREADAAATRGFRAGFTVAETAVTPSSHPLLQGRLDAQRLSLARLASRMPRLIREAA